MSTQVASPISPQDRNEPMGVYKTMFETWRSQVDSYWQRSNYFAVFETAAVSGCWILIRGSRTMEVVAGFLLSMLGIGLTVVWYHSNDKTHTYVLHWWGSIRKIEARLNLAPNDFAEQLTQAQEIRHQRDGGIQYRDLIQRVPLLFGIAWVALLVMAVVRAPNLGSKASLSPTTGTSLTTNPVPSGADVVGNPGFQPLDEPIEPFESGSTVRLEGQPAYQKTICDSDKVKALIEKAKDKRLRLLVAIGSADKFDLTQNLKGIYGSNDGLAQGRADQVLSCLPKSAVSELSLASIRGPSVHGVSASKVDTGEDRSVEVYGFWAEDRSSSGAGEGLLSSLRAFWEHVESGDATAYGAIFALFIGIMATRINANTVRGQRVHEQIRMVLEIDKELIACPQLWGIYDDPNPPATTIQAQPPAPQTVATAIENLVTPLDSLKTALQTAPPLANELQALSDALASVTTGLRASAPAPQTVAIALETLTRPLELLKTALASQPPAPQTVATALESLTMPLESLKTALQRQVNLSASELEGKKKALVFSYLNIFDFVYGFYRRRILIWPRDREQRKAWSNFMKKLFSTSKLTQEVWKDNQTKGIYSKSFTNFVNKKIYPQN